MQPPPQYEEARRIASGSKDDTAIAMTVPNGSCANGQLPNGNGPLKPTEEDNRSDERLMSTEQREDSKDDGNEKKVSIARARLRSTQRF